MRKLTLAVAGLGVLLAAAPAIAHHAFAAEFDANKPVTFKGTVTKMEWTNPHTWLHVDVKLLHVDMKPRVGIGPFHFCDRPLEGHRFVRIEFRCECVMGDGRSRGEQYAEAGNGEGQLSHRILPPITTSTLIQTSDDL